MLEKLVHSLMQWCEKRGKVFKITGTAGPDDVYLIRYYVLKSRWCNIFIHQFLRSDRDDLHDHPWNFCTYLVSGSYTEKMRVYAHNSDGSYLSYHDDLTRRTTESNRFVFRKATDQHQVIVDQDLKEKDKDKAALTLFISGPTKREWGFIKDNKWVEWREYLGLPKDTPGRG